MEPVENMPSWMLTQTAAHAGRLVSEGFAAVGARGYHYRVLSALITDGPASQADLGRRTGIHLSDMVTALNELEASGYIRRVPNPDDRRRNIITITGHGIERAEALALQARAVQEEFLAPLDEAERAQLTALLRKLYDHHLSQGFPPLSKM
ncbi:MarR family winged helix-turn-helix transcriptional regulator [Paractinoplanes globisporus]|uniref:MarR family winged helix-turn-helix transcriptional regulator n=1 Tax=Paractinoplanes globisporus TaxID=113565 RepID=A0ABW6WBH4_9ACTN|nr:MarR family winged helix-turn-helix transcriptional regulator [Actinoplanes globisporus]